MFPMVNNCHFVNWFEVRQKAIFESVGTNFSWISPNITYYLHFLDLALSFREIILLLAHIGRRQVTPHNRLGFRTKVDLEVHLPKSLSLRSNAYSSSDLMDQEILNI